MAETRTTNIGLQAEYKRTEGIFITNEGLQIEYKRSEGIFITNVGLQVEYYVSTLRQGPKVQII
jgi:hypothetical protein